MDKSRIFTDILCAKQALRKLHMGRSKYVRMAYAKETEDPKFQSEHVGSCILQTIIKEADSAEVYPSIRANTPKKEVPDRQASNFV